MTDTDTKLDREIAYLESALAKLPASSTWTAEQLRGKLAAAKAQRALPPAEREWYEVGTI